MLAVELSSNNSDIFAREVNYFPEEKKVQLNGDISIEYNDWTFLADSGDFLIEEKKLLLHGSENRKASFSNQQKTVFGESNYIEVNLEKSIDLQGEAELTSNLEHIKSNKISYKFVK